MSLAFSEKSRCQRLGILETESAKKVQRISSFLELLCLKLQDTVFFQKQHIYNHALDGQY